MDTNLEHCRQLLDQIINPATKKTLSSEKRWQSIEVIDEQLVIVYKRDGITAQQKREIEDDIVSALKGEREESRIMVKTVSATAVSEAEAPPAQIKVGHGKLGAKKRVEGVGKVVAVSSCKGGVGKSTVTINLALALRNLGAQVGILDADIYGPSTPMLLGERQAQVKAGDNKKILPVQTKGIKFLSFGLFTKEQEAVIWRGPMLGGVLNQFLFDTDWGKLDYLLLDLPPGTGDVQLSLVQNTEVDLALVVTTPQDLATLDTRKGVEMFKKMGTKVGGIIENMSYFVTPDTNKTYYIFGRGGGAALASQLGIELLAEVPLEMTLQEGSDAGLPYMDNPAYEGQAAWKSYIQIASKIDKMVERKKTDRGFFKKLFKR